MGVVWAERARTLGGKRVVRARDIDPMEVQDKSRPLLIIGADVEQLYPSLEDETVADIAYNAVIETPLEFDNIDYKEGVRYIALNWTAQECRLSNLCRVLPARSKKKGSRPGMTGQGPLGHDSGDHLDQWSFPKVTLTKLEKRRILANFIRIAVLTMFNTHIYSFDSRYYLQQKGGPIGLRATCAVARLAMVDWDKQ